MNWRNKCENTKILIRELRDEYLNICKKIAAAKFALKTLPFDEQENRIYKLRFGEWNHMQINLLIVPHMLLRITRRI